MYIDNKVKEYSSKMENLILGNYLVNVFPNHIGNAKAEDVGALFLSVSSKERFSDFKQNIGYESGSKAASLTYSINSLSNIIEASRNSCAFHGALQTVLEIKGVKAIVTPIQIVSNV